ncbi:MAG: hypothetical protein LBQ68_02780 [Clostridiales bacterium]|jgi:hypothetical protein|nr:hypothetical protein [Clostridiales bacterium]
MKKLLLIITIIFAFSGCGRNTVIDTSTPTPTEVEVHQEQVEIPTGDYDQVFGENIETRFELTESQRALYDAYVKDFNFDTSLLKDASAIDTAHIYIECGINGLWEGEYNLFYFKSKPLSKVSYKEENDKDLATLDIRTRRDMANIVFPFLSDGEFTDNGDGTGYIDFESVHPEDYSKQTLIYMRVNMVQSDGVWLIDFDNKFEYPTI